MDCQVSDFFHTLYTGPKPPSPSLLLFEKASVACAIVLMSNIGNSISSSLSSQWFFFLRFHFRMEMMNPNISMPMPATIALETIPASFLLNVLFFVVTPECTEE